MRMLITGSGGLVGSEAALYFMSKGWEVTGVDNDTRAKLFGKTASVEERLYKLMENPLYKHYALSVANRSDMRFVMRATEPDAIIHTAAQPSHDWAAQNPQLDFDINAVGTMNLLEAAHDYSPAAPFVFTSTNKVYGDNPNKLPFIEDETRFTVPPAHRYGKGIDETMSIDHTMHSLFGVSKTAADLLVQEYGSYFGMQTVSFRCGCITGPAHKGAELHGFLSYLVKCAKTGTHYTVFGYGGKQVRDNIHAYDLVKAFEAFIEAPEKGGLVYNMGGGSKSNCSVLEAIRMTEEITKRPLEWSHHPEARAGDHKWWISDTSQFEHDYDWEITYKLGDIIGEINDAHLH
jgi:CDP-paratose 2-epimerase